MRSRIALSLLILIVWCGASNASSHFLIDASGSRGQGFEIDVNNKCYIATVNHLFERGYRDVYAFSKEGERHALELVASHHEKDVAILKIVPEPRYYRRCGKNFPLTKMNNYRRLERFVNNHFVNNSHLRVDKVQGKAGGLERIEMLLTFIDAINGRLVMQSNPYRPIIASDSGAMVTTGSYNADPVGEGFPVGMITGVLSNGDVNVLHLDEIVSVALDHLQPMPNISVSPNEFSIVRKARGKAPNTGYIGGNSDSGLTIYLQTTDRHKLVKGIEIDCETRFTDCIDHIEFFGGEDVSFRTKRWKRLKFESKYTGRGLFWSKGRGRFEFYGQHMLRTIRINLVGDYSELSTIAIHSE